MKAKKHMYIQYPVTLEATSLNVKRNKMLRVRRRHVLVTLTGAELLPIEMFGLVWLER